jgi:MobA/MobL family
MALYRVSLKHHGHKGTSRAASAGEHAAYIVRDLQTPETKAYVEYVLRQSRTSKDREDLAHAEWHNLPAWAGDNPVTFFLQAERYEGANRRVSSSLEIALPRELPRAAQIALMQDYCASQFGRHPYLLGLHDSTGASGEPNPHFHVTWSARIHDGVARPLAEYFRRPPHGAGKDPIFRETAWLVATRQAWADLANVYLEQYGIEHAYVDSRSLKAREIDRAPEQRLSPDHSTKVKLGKGITPEWQAVLDGRQARAASRADEQTLAQAAWIIRKAELGITDVNTLDRTAFVEQIAQQTREQARQPVQRPSLEHLREQAQALEQDITQQQAGVNRIHAEVMIATHRERQQGRDHQQERMPQRDISHSMAGLALEDEPPVPGRRGLQVDTGRRKGRDGYGW